MTTNLSQTAAYICSITDPRNTRAKSFAEYLEISSLPSTNTNNYNELKMVARGGIEPGIEDPQSGRCDEGTTCRTRGFSVARRIA